LVDKDLLWTSLTALYELTCGATDAGHLYCWGLFQSGLVPDGTETCEIGAGKGGPVVAPCTYKPLRIRLRNPLGADSVFTQVSGRCALTTQGSVYCYEESAAAFLSKPGFGPFVSITGGDYHNCGLTAGGTARCWGSNGLGQLGDGTTLDRTSPFTVEGGHVWTQIAAGSNHTCGLEGDEVWCWGASRSGQTGGSILEDVTVPIKAHGQD
jgi:hypothetical protein